MKYYYLFGSQICDAFDELGKASKLTRVEKSALKRVADRHGYDLICHDTAVDHPNRLLEQYDGWMSYILNAAMIPSTIGHLKCFPIYSTKYKTSMDHMHY